MLSRSFGALSVLLLVACGDDTGGAGGAAAMGAEGDPCSSDEACGEGLECDDSHEERTCEVPHEHTTTSASGTSATSTGTEATSSSTGSGSGGGGEGGGEPASLCDAYCACLGTTCSSLPGYPFTEPSSCETACDALTAEELSCFGGFCEQAAQSGGTEHACEHAWGGVGTDEC